MNHKKSRNLTNKKIKKILHTFSDVEVPNSLEKSLTSKICRSTSEFTTEPRSILFRIRRNISVAAAAVIIPIIVILIFRLNFSFADTKTASLPFDTDLSNQTWQTLPVDNNFALIADINIVNYK